MNANKLIWLALAILGLAAASSSASTVEDKERSTASIKDQLYKTTAGERAPEELEEFLKGLKKASPIHGFRMKPARMDKNTKVPENDQVSVPALQYVGMCCE
jgi:hypothetical protein